MNDAAKQDRKSQSVWSPADIIVQRQVHRKTQLASWREPLNEQAERRAIRDRHPCFEGAAGTAEHDRASESTSTAKVDVANRYRIIPITDAISISEGKQNRKWTGGMAH